MKSIAIRTVTLCSTAVLAIILTNCFWIIFIGFTSSGVGSLSMCDGKGMGGFSEYKSYDGEKLASGRVSFESTEEAQKCFQSTIDYSQMIDRETLFNREGDKIVGERIVTLDPNTKIATIIAVDEIRINTFTSTSLRHALIFEKRIRKY